MEWLCQVDVFSFGISMWELLTGEEPYADMHCGAIIGKNLLTILFLKGKLNSSDKRNFVEGTE